MKAGINQHLCSLILSIPSFMASFSVVWPSYAIQMLESDNTPLAYKISKQDGYYIGSFTMLGSFVVTLFVGYMSDWIGRKNSEILSGLFFTLSWAIIATAKTPIQILIGRFLFGVGMGIHFVVGLIYSGEMAHQSTRGTATSMLFFAYSIGTLCSYLTGWFCSYDFICYLNVSLGVSFVVLISFMKDTPSYLIGKGKEKEALKSLKFYRGVSSTTADILEEFNYIKSQRLNNAVDSKLEKSQFEAENEKLDKGSHIKLEKEISSWKLVLTCKPTQRALVSLSMIVILAVFMGMIGVQTYAGQFFSTAVPDMSPDLCSVVLALVLAVASGVSASVTDMCDRRVLMISSTSITSCVLALLGSQLRWSWAPNWMVPLLVVFFCISYQFGANNIPLVQATESFRPEIRGLAVQLLLSFICISNFILLLLFGPVVEYLGLDVTFFVFSLIGVIITIVVFFIMRETRGVPLEIVQEMYANGYLYRKIVK